MSGTRIRFLIDENVPWSVGDFLEQQGHDVYRVGEHFAKMTPDLPLLVAAELHGLVIVTFDRDFDRLVRKAPHGTRRQIRRNAGRISLKMREPTALGRIQYLIEHIELNYELAQRRGSRFIMQISETSYTIAE